MKKLVLLEIKLTDKQNGVHITERIIGWYGMRFVNIDDCDRELFYKQCGGKDSLITVETVFNMLEALPTYDIEKVVEQLEEEARFYNSASDTDQAVRTGILKSIEIVKAGGKE